jgi:sugar phosphate isomerase/epimerase
MKFAICNELFEAWNTDKGFDFPRVVEYVKKCGYTGIEIAPFTLEKDAFFISAARRMEIRRCAEQNGLEITGLHWLLAKTEGYYLTSPDPVMRQKTADYFLELIRLCADLGGHFMVLGSPLQRNILPDVTKDQAFDYAADVLQKLVPMLEKCDVQIALEPLAPRETNFMTTAAEGVRLIDKVGVPSRIALHLDCKAMDSEELSIPEVIRANKNTMIYFHLNDPNLRGPGFGELDFVPIMGALLDIGYTGWASVEVFDYTPGIELLAEKSLTHTQTCLDAARRSTG